MGDLQFDERIGEVHPPKVPGELSLSEHVVGKGGQAQYGFCTRKEGGSEVRNERGEEGRREDAHIKIKPRSKTSGEH